MNDYTWPSVYFAYLFFFLSLGLAVFFFVRSLKDGYWNRESEEIKLQVFEEELGTGTRACRVDTRVDAWRLASSITIPAGQPEPQSSEAENQSRRAGGTACATRT